MAHPQFCVKQKTGEIKKRMCLFDTPSMMLCLMLFLACPVKSNSPTFFDLKL